ncbi:molecular chaperone [Lysobacter cavernae]|uniref:Molecular chaperone n=1 Tax=Lysobacter cavernae TaxID=1685901 RepID=A0ABV7RNM7_9GAMM
MKMLLTLLALLVAGTAHAASIVVRPTMLILPAGESTAAITVTNNGSQPVNAQVRVFGWDQAQNEDQLQPTQALAASPPMTAILPGQSQTVRLVRVDKTPATREESYRLLVDEITDRASTQHTGVAIQLRYSVPVFVVPDTRATATLAVKAELDGGQVLIDARNSGQSHARISNVALQYADGTSQVIGEGLVGYVLPGKDRQWRLPLPAHKAPPRQVKAEVNEQALLVDL